MTEMPGETPALADHEILAANALTAPVSQELRNAFTARLAAWKASWRRPEVRRSSYTRDYTTGPEFEAIVELGSEALPLVVEQIVTEPDGFFLLAALERWQGRTDLVAASAEHPFESQQSRARRAVREIIANR